MCSFLPHLDSYMHNLNWTFEFVSLGMLKIEKAGKDKVTTNYSL